MKILKKVFFSQKNIYTYRFQLIKTLPVGSNTQIKIIRVQVLGQPHQSAEYAILYVSFSPEMGLVKQENKESFVKGHRNGQLLRGTHGWYGRKPGNEI